MSDDPLTDTPDMDALASTDRASDLERERED
jgi:hypothetical protein